MNFITIKEPARTPPEAPEGPITPTVDMDPSTLLPIRPTSPTLSAHLAALNTTISQLDSLPSQTRWPAYIPLTSRARIPGQIVHPNEVKVNLGEGWWVDMTASEAGGYLKRRKMGE